MFKKFLELLNSVLTQGIAIFFLLLLIVNVEVFEKFFRQIPIVGYSIGLIVFLFVFALIIFFSILAGAEIDHLIEKIPESKK